MIEQQTIEWIKQNQTVCISPYSTRDLRIQHQDLKVTCCCNLDTHNFKPLDFDQIDKIGQAMALGQKPAECRICWETEANGGHSERMKYLVSRSLPELQEFDATRKLNEFTIGAKFSNKCNLACRSCNSHNSSFYTRTMKQPQDPKVVMDISEDPVFWKEFTDRILAASLEYQQFGVHPIGGETLLTDGFLKLLHWIDQNNIAHKIVLKLTTSFATGIDSEMWDMFDRYRKVEFLTSIDSVGDNYHCVRWPARFDKVERNLQEFLNRNTHGKFDLYVTPVFSLNNIFYAEEFLNWWHQWAQQHSQKLFLQNTYLYNPQCLMIETLPEHYWPGLRDILSKCVQHDIFVDHPNTNELWSYFNTLAQSHSNNNQLLWNKFLKYTAQYDIRTNTSSEILNKKLFDILNADDHKAFQDYKNSTDPTQPYFHSQ